MKEELAATKAELGRLKPIADLLGDDPDAVTDIRRAIAAARTGMYSQSPQPRYEAPPQDMKVVKEELQKEFLSDPVGFIARAVEQGTNQAMNRGVSPLQAQTSDLFVENFLNEKSRDDEDFKIISPEFEKLKRNLVPPGALANLNRDQIRTTLNTIYDAAYGQVAQKAKKSAGSRGLLGGTREEPPQYSSKGTPQKAEPVAPKAFEDDEVAELRKLGYSEAQIKDLATIEDEG